MNNRRFGSANLLFLTAVLGMAGSAAAGAAGNAERNLTKKDSSNLNAIDLVGMENKLVDAKVKTKKLLKLIALALGITTGTVTIGGVVYYFKDPEHRQKFLQAISERFGKGELSEKEIDKAIEELQPNEEKNKNLDQPEETKIESSEEQNKGTDSTEEQNEPNNAENVDQNTQNSTDETESLLDDFGNGGAFANGVNSVYGYRDAILKLLPIVKGRVALSENSEELLTLLDKYGMFLGKDVFDGQTFYAVFKLVHVLLIVLNAVESLILLVRLWKNSGYKAVGKWWFSWDEDSFPRRFIGNKGRKVDFVFYFGKVIKTTFYLLHNVASIVLPGYSLVGVGLQGKSLYDARKVIPYSFPVKESPVRLRNNEYNFDFNNNNVLRRTDSIIGEATPGVQ